MSEKAHGPVSERFIRHHYGASGYVKNPPEDIAVAAVVYCKENELDCTLGFMRHMALFAEQQLAKYGVVVGASSKTSGSDLRAAGTATRVKLGSAEGSDAASAHKNIVRGDKRP